MKNTIENINVGDAVAINTLLLIAIDKKIVTEVVISALQFLKINPSLDEIQAMTYAYSQYVE